MEMAGHGDLLEYIRLRGAIPEEKARCMFKQIVEGVEYLHSLNIVHRDLKCENILLDKNNTVKVSDFGFSRFMNPDEQIKTYCGSAAYAAPEILQGKPYVGSAYDVWSMGVILYSMVNGCMPFDDSDVKQMVRRQREKKIHFSRTKKISQQCKELIQKMLDPVPSKRASINEILKSKWLQPTECPEQQESSTKQEKTTKTTE